MLVLLWFSDSYWSLLIKGSFWIPILRAFLLFSYVSCSDYVLVVDQWFVSLVDFKTPTRRSRPRSGVFHSGSPQNDSDFQQDIIWDATSPSPRRLGNLWCHNQKRTNPKCLDVSTLCLCLFLHSVCFPLQVSEAGDSERMLWTYLKSLIKSLQRSVTCS